MKHKLLLTGLLYAVGACVGPLCADDKISKPSVVFKPAATIVEARSRAVLLHELIRGTLQVVHRDFFDEDDSRAIPSSSMEDVFDEMAKIYNVELKWLNVETDVINIDHQPNGEFEEAAVMALKTGKSRHEAVADDHYHFAGPIRLASQCLKCHVKHRTSTEDRTAGLLISMPLKAGP